MSYLLVVITLTVGAFSCKKDEPVIESLKRVFVANEEGQSVSVIDAGTNTKLLNIDLSDSLVTHVMPHNVQVSPDGKCVWVTGISHLESDAEQVIVIDPVTNSVIRRVYIGHDLHLAHVVLDDTGENAFVTAYEGDKVYQVSALTYELVDSFQVDTLCGLHGMRYRDGKLYVADLDGYTLTIINVNSGEVTHVPVGGMAVQTAVTPDGHHVFVSLYDTREVARYTVSTQQLSKIPLPAGAQGPIQLYPTPDNKYLYICDQGGLLGRPSSNKVYVMDIAMDSIVAAVTVGNQSHGVVLSDDGRFAYVTNIADNSVSVISTANNTVIATIPVGAAPNGISYWYGTGGMP